MGRTSDSMMTQHKTIQFSHLGPELFPFPGLGYLCYLYLHCFQKVLGKDQEKTQSKKDQNYFANWVHRHINYATVPFSLDICLKAIVGMQLLNHFEQF